MADASIAVIIPALNEEASIGKVLSALSAAVNDVLVVDNGSTDRTVEVAQAHGARVILEPRRGYGAACLAGIGNLQTPDVVVFLDADFSDDPTELENLVAPILADRADLVIGSRTRGNAERGALTITQRMGNALACALMRFLWGATYSDLGPFRAIRASSLLRLDMSDRNYGWTVQMQARAVRLGLRIEEVPVSYRKRIGRSKISGTLRGILGAGTKILYTIAREALRRQPPALPLRKRICVFSRYPIPGSTKTRLIPALGKEGAAELQRQMTAHTMGQCRLAQKQQEADVEIRFSGGSEKLMQECFGADVSYVSQGEGHLGEKLERAFRDAFHAGVRAMLAIGSDSPELSSRTLCDAFAALAHHDLVIGPAQDGGYYLIGMKRLHSSLFRNIAWGSPDVLQETLRDANEAHLSCHFLRALSDVDRPEDLAVWARVKSQEACARESITVIVPTLNESAYLPLTLEGLGNEKGIEVVVVDGGSTDPTCALAQEWGVQVLHAPPGRAIQMNHGAAHAHGEILVFLHADTRLPRGFSEHVRQALRTPCTAAGAFRLSIDGAGPGLRLAERMINLRSRLLGLPYGDQAFFVRRDLFLSLGGFRDLPVMEDFEFVRRVKQAGRIHMLASSATTSARRWREYGMLRYTLQNQWTVAAYLLGVSPIRLERWRQRGRPYSGAPEKSTSRPPKRGPHTPAGTQSSVSS